MSRPGGNPDLKSVRNSDTTKATQRLQQMADLKAQRISGALLWAIREGVVDQAADGHDKAAWRAWLNALDDDRYLTQRKHPWTKKAFNRMLKRMSKRGLAPLAPDANDTKKWLAAAANSTSSIQPEHSVGNKVGN